jgi:thioredoxin reductase (NADPH)
MSNNKHDLIVVGAGPAGLTAALYGSRSGLDVAVLERAMPGGYMSMVDFIENYPGFPEGLKGMELSEKMKIHTARFGASMIGTEVKSIKKDDQLLRVETSSRNLEAHAVIIATGTIPRHLGVPGEEKLRGRGISYCATCDGPLFKGKKIAVIGCGNAGLQEGHFLLNFVTDISFVEYQPVITADKVIQDRFISESRARFFLNHEVVSINGSDRVQSITVKDRIKNTTRDIDVDGIFIYIGMNPNSHFLRGVVELDNKGYVVTNERLETSLSGVYAAGDIRKKHFRQIVIACGDGAVAALHAYDYIQSMKL